jgi:hypothetical protein
MLDQLSCQIAEQSSPVGRSSAEVVDFVSVTHDLVRLSFTPCQELQSGFKKCKTIKV